MKFERLKAHLALYRSHDHQQSQKDAEALCQAATPYTSRISATKFLASLNDDHSDLCDQCAFLARIAVANGINLNHFQLDQKVREILKKASS